MKSSLSFAFAGMFVAALLSTSCSKNAEVPDTSGNANTGTSSALALQANNQFMQTEVFGGTETEAFVENDGVPDVYLLTASAMSDKNGDNPVRGNSVKDCLDKLNLTQEQRTQVGKAMGSYEECKKQSLARYQNAYHELHMRMERSRMELVKSFRDKKIGPKDFEAAMKKLQAQYKEEQEKLKAAEANSLKECYDKFLSNLQQILTAEQWAQFVDCMKQGTTIGGK